MDTNLGITDINLLNTVITVLGTVLVSLFGFLAAKKDTAHMSRKKELQELQLNHVLEPMDKLLSYTIGANSEDVLIEINKIIYENYKLVPPEIILEIKKAQEDDRSIENNTELKALVSSLYNTSRKNLGYPYYRQSHRRSRIIRINIVSNDSKYSVMQNMIMYSIYFLYLYAIKRLGGVPNPLHTTILFITLGNLVFYYIRLFILLFFDFRIN